MKLIQVLTLTTITLLALNCTPARQLAEQSSQPELKNTKSSPYLESKAKTVIVGVNSTPQTPAKTQPIIQESTPKANSTVNNQTSNVNRSSSPKTPSPQPLATSETPTKTQPQIQESTPTANSTVHRQASAVRPTSKLTEKVQLVLSSDREVVVDLHIIPRGEANIKLIQNRVQGNEDTGTTPEVSLPKQVTGYAPPSSLAASNPPLLTPHSTPVAPKASEGDDFDLFAAFVEETREMDKAEDPQEVLQRLLTARMDEGKHSEPASRAMEIPTAKAAPNPELKALETEKLNYIKVEIAEGKVVRLKEDVLIEWENAIANNMTKQADLPAWIFQGLERITDIPLIEPIRTEALTPMYKYMINAGLLDDVNVNSMNPIQVVSKMRMFFDTMKVNSGKLSI